MRLTCATYSDFAFLGVRPSSVVSNSQPEDLGRLFARPNSQRLSSEYNIRSHTLLHSSSQDDFSDDALSPSTHHSRSSNNVHTSSPSATISPRNHHSKYGTADNDPSYQPSQQSDWQSKRSVTNRSASLEPPKPIAKPVTAGQLPPRAPYDKQHSPTTPSAQIGSHQPYASVTKQGQTASAAEVPAITPRQVGRSLPRPRQHVNEDDEWDSNGATLSRPRDKASNDSIDLNEIQGILGSIQGYY